MNSGGDTDVDKEQTHVSNEENSELCIEPCTIVGGGESTPHYHMLLALDSCTTLTAISFKLKQPSTATNGGTNVVKAVVMALIFDERRPDVARDYAHLNDITEASKFESYKTKQAHA